MIIELSNYSRPNHFFWLWFFLRLLLSSPLKINRCEDISTLKMLKSHCCDVSSISQILILPACHFLQIRYYLINVYNRVCCFVCRLIIDSKEVTIIDKASFKEKMFLSRSTENIIFGWLCITPSFPEVCWFCYFFVVLYPCTWIFIFLIVCETMMCLLFNFLEPHVVRSLVS